MKQVYNMYIHLLFQSGKSFRLLSLYPLYPQAVAAEPLNLKMLAFEGLILLLLA